MWAGGGGGGGSYGTTRVPCRAQWKVPGITGQRGRGPSPLCTRVGLPRSRPSGWMDDALLGHPPPCVPPHTRILGRSSTVPTSRPPEQPGVSPFPSVLSPRRGALCSATHNTHRRHTSAHRADGLCFPYRAGGSHHTRHWRSFGHRGGSSTTFHRSTPVTHLPSPV